MEIHRRDGYGTDFWDGRIWIDLPLDRSSEAKEVYQTADGTLLVDMNVAFSGGKSDEERKKWFVNTTDAMGILKKDVEGTRRHSTPHATLSYMRSQTYRDKQQEAQRRKKKEELWKKANPEDAPASGSQLNADKPDPAVNKTKKTDKTRRST